MSQFKPVETSERNLTGWDFFLLWAGAAIALPEIWAGGLLAGMGLLRGLVAIGLGHLLGNLAMGAAGLIGSRHGVPAIVSTRAALGRQGAWLAGLLNVIQLLGWTAVMIWIATQAALALPGAHALGKTEWTLIIGALTTFWAMGGRRVWRPLQRVAVILLFLLSIFLTWEVLHTYGFRTLFKQEPSSPTPFLLGLDMVIVMPVSWLPLVADYARYARGNGSSFKGTFFGYFVGSCWMYSVGLIAALATATDSPDSIVLQLLASTGYIGAALFIILLSTLTTTFLDIFSTAISAQSILPRLRERPTVLLVGAAGTALALFFDVSAFEPFLLYVGAAFCPLFGIVLADYFLVKRGQFEMREGVHARALAVWLAGFLIYQAIAHFGWPVGSSLPSFILSAALYLAVARRPGHG